MLEPVRRQNRLNRFIDRLVVAVTEYIMGPRPSSQSKADSTLSILLDTKPVVCTTNSSTLIERITFGVAEFKIQLKPDASVADRAHIVNRVTASACGKDWHQYQYINSTSMFSDVLRNSARLEPNSPAAHELSFYKFQPLDFLLSRLRAIDSHPISPEQPLTLDRRHLVSFIQQNLEKMRPRFLPHEMMCFIKSIARADSADMKCISENDVANCYLTKGDKDHLQRVFLEHEVNITSRQIAEENAKDLKQARYNEVQDTVSDVAYTITNSFLYSFMRVLILLLLESEKTRLRRNGVNENYLNIAIQSMLQYLFGVSLSNIIIINIAIPLMVFFVSCGMLGLDRNSFISINKVMTTLIPIVILASLNESSSDLRFALQIGANVVFGKAGQLAACRLFSKVCVRNPPDAIVAQQHDVPRNP